MSTSPARAAGTDAAAPATTQFPRQGWQRAGRRPERVLLICYYDPAGISTVPETVAFMQSHSRYAVTVVNMFEHRVPAPYLRLPAAVNLDAFDAVVIHNTVSYNIDNVRALDEGLARKLRDFRGAKVLMKQDENFRFRDTARYIGEAGIDVVFTCLPPEAVPVVYPAEAVGPARFERMLTGYVTPTLRALPVAPGPRPIDIGYRGSIQPLSFGWLAYEKRKIGDDVAALLAGRDLMLDISSRWEDRFGGDGWFDFLRSCRATLGAESGASIFDLHGDLEQRCADLEREHAGLPTERERAEAVLAGLADLEDNVRYGQISPRHFEAAACGTLQILFPGTYSGILQPGRHYFELQRDYSNLADAVALVRDDARREEMTARARREVVLARENWIETFVERVDGAIARVLRDKGAERTASVACRAGGHNVLVLAAHDPVLDPRLGWFEEGAGSTMRVCQLGGLEPGTQPRMEVLPGGTLSFAQPRVSWTAELGERLLALLAHSPAGMAAAQELLFLQYAAQLPEESFCALFGAPPGAQRNGAFRWYVQYLPNIAATLLGPAMRMRGIHAVVATDLDTLLPALVLKGLFGVPVLYDAHEYWPEQDVRGSEAEKDFWIALERRLVAHADRLQTVSPGLAALMSAQYGRPFETVPNCEPADRLLPWRERAPRADGSCHFIYQGNFAPGRGLDLLVQAWPETDPRAILQLRGIGGEYKKHIEQLARDTGLLGVRIFLPDVVESHHVVAAAAEADVGLIPYTPAGSNYRHCCPNKLSQYMAAGLPILANATSFVAATVRDAGCGVVADFHRRRQLLDAVRDFCESPQRRVALGRAGHDYFARRFNWDSASAQMYAWLEQAVQSAPEEQLVLFEPGTQEPILRAPEPEPAAQPEPQVQPEPEVPVPPEPEAQAQAEVQPPAQEPPPEAAPAEAEPAIPEPPAQAPEPAPVPIASTEPEPPAPVEVVAPAPAPPPASHGLLRSAWHRLPHFLQRLLRPIARRAAALLRA